MYCKLEMICLKFQQQNLTFLLNMSAFYKIKRKFENELFMVMVMVNKLEDYKQVPSSELCIIQNEISIVFIFMSHYTEFKTFKI